MLLTAGFSGQTALAADLGIIQSAALALYYSFSANARNLILRAGSGLDISGEYNGTIKSLMCFRVLLVIPLGFAAYSLSAGVAGTGVAITAAILLRRASEWLAEIHLAQKELVGDSAFSVKFSVSQLFLLVSVCAVAVCEARFLLFFMLVWAVSPLV
ncbi:MAG: hypothetical protein WCS77_00910, partial [Elusimicrobiaceae bacterium]